MIDVSTTRCLDGIGMKVGVSLLINGLSSWSDLRTLFAHQADCPVQVRPQLHCCWKAHVPRDSDTIP